MADSCAGYATVAKLQHNFNLPMYYYPYTNNNKDMFMNTYSYAVSYTETISEPKVINLPAYGLRHSDIVIKEVDGILTVKTRSGLTGYFATLDKKYAVKNVGLKSSSLSLGVLILEFVDTNNVVRHEVKEV